MLLVLLNYWPNTWNSKKPDKRIRHARLKAMTILVVMILAPAADADGIDLHWLWDDRCNECHGHAGQFSRQFLSVTNGQLQGRHHVRDLRRFMQNHYLIDSEVDAVYNMLLAQANTPARFKLECSSCHDNAARFVRQSLELRDGLLYSRQSNQPARLFLNHHRALEPDEVEFYIKLLTRVAHEVYRP